MTNTSSRPAKQAQSLFALQRAWIVDSVEIRIAAGILRIAALTAFFDGADTMAAEARGTAKVTLSLPQFANLLNEFRCERVSLETSNEAPVIIRGDGGKLALLVRSIGSFAEAKAAA